MERTSRLLDLKIPTQSLDTFSFCDANTRALETWASQLPMANIGECAKRLYHAVIELNQLITPPANRLALLEIVRPPLRYVCRELSKHYLNQSISLPEKQRKIANLSQALQMHLATGYKIVLMEYVNQAAPEKNKKTLAQACHRAITEFGHTILRACQLYCHSPDNVWYELHQIFQFADRYHFRDTKVLDEENHGASNSSIDTPYKQALLLGCCKPNQLRQNDLSAIFTAFEEWSDYVEVGRLFAGSALFVINTQKDAPPVYRSLLHETLNEHYIGLDTNDLVHRITEFLACVHQKKSGADQFLKTSVALPDQIIAHLGQALGILTKRSFKRMTSNGHLLLSAGISAAHYFCANEVEFHTFLLNGQSNAAALGVDGAEGNRFMQASDKRNDAWGQAFDGGGHDALGAVDIPISFDDASQKATQNAFKVYKVALVNTSPGGYCMQWHGDIPGSIQAGEILGVRENENHPWSIAAIRWIRQIKQQGTQLGIELLAPMAKPIGVQLLQKTGDNSEFLRGLMLPELSAIGQPATLITPRLPFQTGQKVMLNDGETLSKCLLNKRLSATNSYSQFELKSLDSEILRPMTAPKASKQQNMEDDFDSLWPSL